MKIPKLSNYKGFLFDFDGTLVPFIWTQAYEQYLLQNGKVPSKNYEKEREELLNKYKDAPNLYVAMMDGINKIYGLDLTGEQGIAQVSDLSYQAQCTTNYKDGAPELLWQLYGNKSPRGIVTSTTDRVIKIYSEQNQNIKNKACLKTIFGGGGNILTCNKIAIRKPAPEPYLKGIEMLGLKSSEILVFEDSVQGATSSLSANLDTCIIHDPTADCDREKLKKMTPFHIASFTELLKNQ